MTGGVRTAILYYGSELPAGPGSGPGHGPGTAVVLQPYHPLLASGQFPHYFPGCPLYVYWNPTGVPAGELTAGGPGRRAAAARPALLGPDPVWHLARLDLRSAGARQVAVRRGLDALAAGGPAAGLFVDDLDRWEADPAAALAVLRALVTAAGRPVRLFVNRGFAFWPDLAGLGAAALDAVLLEELTPALADRLPGPGQRWVRNQVVPAVRAARARGAACFGLSYEPAPEPAARGVAARELAELTDGVLHGRRSLDQWPEELFR